MLQHSLSQISTQTWSVRFPFPVVVPRRRAEVVMRKCNKLCCNSISLNNNKTKTRANANANANQGMSWFYEMEQEVREYELDRFGVVNNSVYSNYCEYGTDKLLEKIGFDADIKMAVSQVSIKYIAPLKKKDRFLIKLRILDYSTIRLYLEYHIDKLPNQEPIFRGMATVVLLDERLRLSRLTPFMISKVDQFLVI